MLNVACFSASKTYFSVHHMTPGMSRLTSDRSVHSHCCPHKNFSASCSSDFHYAWLLQAWSQSLLFVTSQRTVLCLFIPVAIFENAFLDYIHPCWIVCSSVPLPLFISMLEWLCISCVAFAIHSDLMLPVLIIYSTSNSTKKDSPLWLVTSDPTLQKPFSCQKS